MSKLSARDLRLKLVEGFPQEPAEDGDPEQRSMLSHVWRMPIGR